MFDKDEERKKIMEAILNHHYSKAEQVNKARTNSLNQNEERESIDDVNHFYFENSPSVLFNLLGYVRSGRSIYAESSQKFSYQRFEIIHNIIGESSGLKLYCFIPSSDLEGLEGILKIQGKKVTYRLEGENEYSVSLFNVTQQMFGAHSASLVCKCVRSNQIFLISKDTFQDIEQKGIVMSPETESELEPPRKKRTLKRDEPKTQQENHSVKNVPSGFYKQATKPTYVINQNVVYSQPHLQLNTCNLCDFAHVRVHIFKQHMREHIVKEGKKEEYQLNIKSMRGTPCKLLCAKTDKSGWMNSYSYKNNVDYRIAIAAKTIAMEERNDYYKIEVVQTLVPNILPSKHVDTIFSQAFYLFLPQTMLDAHPEILDWKDLQVKCKQREITSLSFQGYFPTFDTLISWASTFADCTVHAKKDKMFVITEKCFEMVQKTRVGEEKFCSYASQTPIFQQKRIKDIKIEDIEEKVFECPMSNCNFISPRKFMGLRNHLVKEHFCERIEKEAKSKLADPEYKAIREESKSQCMSNWNCSLHNLKASGDLVHHYGIYHGMVDRFFNEFGHLRISKLFGNEYFVNNKCPYEGLEFSESEDLVNHLTFDHYIDQIMPELENLLLFKNIKHEGRRKTEIKCPFCKKRFYKDGWREEASSLDKKDVIAHCGADHCFSLYHLISDKSMVDPYSLSTNIKTEDTLGDVEPVWII